MTLTGKMVKYVMLKVMLKYVTDSWIVWSYVTVRYWQLDYLNWSYVTVRYWIARRMQLRDFNAICVAEATELQPVSGLKLKPTARSKSSTGKTARQHEHGRLTTAFTEVRHSCRSWATWIKNITSKPNARRPISILSFHVCLRFKKSGFPHVCPPKSRTHFSCLVSAPLPWPSGPIYFATLTFCVIHITNLHHLAHFSLFHKFIIDLFNGILVKRPGFESQSTDGQPCLSSFPHLYRTKVWTVY